METKIVTVPPDGENLTSGQELALKCAGEVLRGGGLVAFPTETVYGLGGDALNRDSAKKIYAAKGRPSDNPLIVHVCCVEDIEKIAHMNEEAYKIAKAFWPGPLTMILPKKEVVPYETTGGLDTVAVRFPSHPVAQRLIALGGRYIAAPSANVSGKPSPTVAKYVAEDMDGKIDMIVDGGEVGIGLESTIIDLTVKPPQILRPGYITEQMLKAVLGEVDTDVTILDAASGQAPKAPGMKYRHYAPKGELTIVTLSMEKNSMEHNSIGHNPMGHNPMGHNSMDKYSMKKNSMKKVTDYINERVKQDTLAGEKVGVIATEETVPFYRAEVIKSVGSREDEESIARRLYTILREFDEENVTRIYSEGFGTQGLGQAIMNRLLKAAGHKIIEL